MDMAKTKFLQRHLSKGLTADAFMLFTTSGNQVGHHGTITMAGARLKPAGFQCRVLGQYTCCCFNRLQTLSASLWVSIKSTNELDNPGQKKLQNLHASQSRLTCFREKRMAQHRLSLQHISTASQWAWATKHCRQQQLVACSLLVTCKFSESGTWSLCRVSVHPGCHRHVPSTSSLYLYCYIKPAYQQPPV
ncbi:uncharacterized protein LOC115893272 [Rhinopithecus roxellana]|uniref:uncharacterized protein LOC115893272 n=1 Tax=Rhinopithecus roxellana TaxID=61622 RepID=UPI0012378BB9|nr:uncharacterized protein LOC115893272 [Rhinopithecus roxellana]